MFALPSLGGGRGNIVPPPALVVESVIDVQIMPSHKKTFPLRERRDGSTPRRDIVSIPIVAGPRLSPLAKNVPAPTRGGRKAGASTRSPRMKRIDREAYIAALKSLPPLPKVQSEPQGLSLALPQIPKIPIMLPNVAYSSFEDLPQEAEPEALSPEPEALSPEPKRFNWGSEPEDEDEEEVYLDEEEY